MLCLLTRNFTERQCAIRSCAPARSHAPRAVALGYKYRPRSPSGSLHAVPSEHKDGLAVDHLAAQLPALAQRPRVLPALLPRALSPVRRRAPARQTGRGAAGRGAAGEDQGGSSPQETFQETPQETRGGSSPQETRRRRARPWAPWSRSAAPAPRGGSAARAAARRLQGAENRDVRHPRRPPSRARRIERGGSRRRTLASPRLWQSLWQSLWQGGAGREAPGRRRGGRGGAVWESRRGRTSRATPASPRPAVGPPARLLHGARARARGPDLD